MRKRLGSGMARRGGVLGGLVGCALLALAVAAPAQQILPPGFFAQIPADAGSSMAVEADMMVFDQGGRTVRAEGNVGLNYQGYRARADRAVYHQASGRVELSGNVALIDPDGVEYTARSVELEGGFREGFLEALVVAFPDGSRFSAAETRFDEGVERVYTEGVYAPCGTCVDAQGRTIGWQVRAARIVTNERDRTLYFEEPALELLGVPIARLPWLALPADAAVEFPVLDYNERFGLAVSFPFFRNTVADGSLAFTPTLFSRQGLMLGADWSQRLGQFDYRVVASAIYQFDPDAYTGLANRGFRGAVETGGTYRPTDALTLGWSYTAVTDPGYLPDYNIASDHLRNEVYAEYLTPETFGEVRLQQFVPLGNQPDAAAFRQVRDEQAAALPNARIDHVVDLEDGAGRVALMGRLLGISRLADHLSDDFSGTRHVFGHAGNKVHAMAQASWTNRWIVPGGVAVSPYLGLRADAAHYDGTSALAGAPAMETLLTATPIAALDIRYPLLARTSAATHIIEPVAQIVYRGSGISRVGITNDDAQSFVFDDTNLFSFDRFSGSDRQETGLRANVGVTLQTSFDGGGWLSATVGQSFHLAGTNAFSVTDGSTAGIGAGLDADASYVVAGIQGGFTPHLTLGGKVQYDPATNTIPHGQIALEGALDGYGLAAHYIYSAENPALGTTEARHEAGVAASIPLHDYWTASAGIAWDFAQNEWLETTAALTYDDRFLAYGLQARWTGPTHRSADEFRVMATFQLRTAGAAATAPHAGLDPVWRD